MKLKNGRELSFDRTLVMGVLNVTPNSFSDGGRYTDTDSAVKQARQMIADGADIIDIGGESSRPGSEPVDTATERSRTIPVIEQIRAFSDIPLSIDTTKAEIAEEAISAGADIINDISALRFDDNMIDIARRHDTPVILMHMLGQPKTMQKNPHYEDCIKEIKEFFEERLNFCEKNGLDRNRLIIDPGIGFGKRLEDNLAILRWLHLFKDLGVPVMMGASRKSFIGMITGHDRPAGERLGGSLAALIAALRADCDIVRVHDVAETVEAIMVTEAIKETS